METTRMSSKGQVIIPKAVREANGWREGVELIVESRPEGILLKRKSPFKPTTLDEVAGCLKNYYSGPAKTIEEMQAGIDEAMRERWERKKG